MGIKMNILAGVIGVLATATSATSYANQLPKAGEPLTTPFWKNTSMDSRIVGGKDIDIESVPATVAILDTDLLALTGSHYQAQYCGGTLIAPTLVLSAAHCMLDYYGRVTNPEKVLILSGSSDLDYPVTAPVAVEEIIIHEDYDPSIFDYDIALIRLSQPQPAQVAPLDNEVVNTSDPALIAGWGTLEFASGIFPSVIQGAETLMIPGEVCGLTFPYYHGAVGERHVCAGLLQGGVDTCSGDSGGPLYRIGDGANRSVVGITSFGIGCGEDDSPGVYTSVSAFRDWILQNTTAEEHEVITQGDKSSSQSEIEAADTSTKSGAAWFLIPLLSAFVIRQRKLSVRQVKRAQA